MSVVNVSNKILFYKYLSLSIIFTFVSDPTSGKVILIIPTYFLKMLSPKLLSFEYTFWKYDFQFRNPNSFITAKTFSKNLKLFHCIVLTKQTCYSSISRRKHFSESNHENQHKKRGPGLKFDLQIENWIPKYHLWRQNLLDFLSQRSRHSL